MLLNTAESLSMSHSMYCLKAASPGASRMMSCSRWMRADSTCRLEGTRFGYREMVPMPCFPSDGTITISRWAKVEDAIGAKRTIDGSGCGGGCVKVHVIIHFDPENGAARERERAIDNYLEQQREGAQ